MVADQGNRGVALLDLQTRASDCLSERFAGKRLNSPNDVAVGPDGSIWFTDPPYGLEGLDASPLKEQAANGVYRLAPNGQGTRIESQSGIPERPRLLRSDGRTLYVSNSDPKNPVIMAYRLSNAGRMKSRRVFIDLTAESPRQAKPGLPDGMTVDKRGNLWATGPGGVRVISSGGQVLGMIPHDKAISNCTFGGTDGRTLFMTATDQVLALRTNVGGAPVTMPRIRPEGASDGRHFATRNDRRWHQRGDNSVHLPELRATKASDSRSSVWASFRRGRSSRASGIAGMRGLAALVSGHP